MADKLPAAPIVFVPTAVRRKTIGVDQVSDLHPRLVSGVELAEV